MQPLGRRALASVTFVASLAAWPAPAAEPLDVPTIHALVKKARDAWQVPGVVVAVIRGDEECFFADGVREIGGSEKVTPDTVFPLASCSKAFTTTAMAILVDEAKMAWDDPVRKHVPFFRLSDPLVSNAVLLRDLVTHRTGLRGHEMLWYCAPWSPEEAVRRAGLLPLERPFRSAFQYQSTMFTAAGLAVSSAAGMPWHDFVKQRLLDPLEMKATVFNSTAADKAADRAAGHRLNEANGVERMSAVPMAAPDAAGSIYSTGRDLAKWLRFHLGDGRSGGKRLVSERNLEETHTPQTTVPLIGVERELHPETVQMSYALAWVVQDYRGEKLVSHAGVLDGFRIHLTLVPRRRIGIVVLANLHATRMNLALSNALLDHLLGAPKKDWDRLYLGVLRRESAKVAERTREWKGRQVRNTRPGHDLSEYAGRYEHPAYGTAEVKIEKGVPVLHWNSFVCPLEHFHYETFVLHEPTMLQDPPVLFKPGPTGEVASMHIQGWFDTEFRKTGPQR